jgi:hypothetical protein
VSDEGAGTAVVAFAGHFMIAVNDTPAFTSGPKLNADVSLSVIMDARYSRHTVRETSDRFRNARFLADHPGWLLKVADGDKT